MKKAIMPVRLRHVIHNVIYSVVIVGGILTEIFLLEEMKDNDSLRQEVQVEEVGEVEEVNEEPIHILTDSELSQLYSLNPQPINDTCLSLTDDDAQALMKIAVVEDNTDVKVQEEIMMVILNRIASEEFPDTIIGVITQDNPIQFSTVPNGSFRNAVPDVNSHLALAAVESRQVKSEALYFEADSASDTWQSKNRTYLYTVGHTRFYK